MRSKTCNTLIRSQEPALQQSACNSMLAGWTHWVLRGWGGHSTYWIYKVEIAGVSPSNKYLQTCFWGRCMSNFIGEEREEPKSLIYVMEKASGILYSSKEERDTFLVASHWDLPKQYWSNRLKTFFRIPLSKWYNWDTEYSFHWASRSHPDSVWFFNPDGFVTWGREDLAHSLNLSENCIALGNVLLNQRCLNETFLSR